MLQIKKKSKNLDYKNVILTYSQKLQNGFEYKKNSQLFFKKNSLQKLNKCLQKFYLSARNPDGHRFGHCSPKL